MQRAVASILVIAAIAGGDAPSVQSAQGAGETALGCFAPGQTPAAVIASCSAALDQGRLPNEARIAALLARAGAEAAGATTPAARTDTRRDYDAVLAADRTNVPALLGRARISRADDPAAAEADYGKVIALAAASPALAGAAYAERAALRLARGATADGIADLGEARRLAPGNPIPFKTRGGYLLQKKDYAAAESDLARAAELDPRDGEADRLLGLARLGQGHSDGALVALTAALAIAPADAASLRARAAAYAQKRDFAAAIADFTAAIHVDAGDIAAWKGRGVAALQSGAFDQAVADLTKALELAPKDSETLFLRGDARLQHGDMAEAEADLSSVLRERPDDEEALFDRALAREFADELAPAEADYTAILAKNPRAARALSGRGAVRVMRGSYADAGQDFAAALRLPDAPAELSLWKFIADARAGRSDALQSLRAAWPPHGDDAGPWPAPVARYLLGELSGDQLLTLARAADATPARSAGRLCEAYFYLGEAALVQRNAEEAARLFAAARATGMTRYTEYAAAGSALARLAGHRP